MIDKIKNLAVLQSVIALLLMPFGEERVRFIFYKYCFY